MMKVTLDHRAPAVKKGRASRPAGSQARIGASTRGFDVIVLEAMRIRVKVEEGR
jgi:hypothetical protein